MPVSRNHSGKMTVCGSYSPKYFNLQIFFDTVSCCKYVLTKIKFGIQIFVVRDRQQTLQSGCSGKYGQVNAPCA